MQVINKTIRFAYRLLSLHWTWFLLFSIPFITLFIATSILGVDIPFSDELNFTPLLTKAMFSSDELGVQDFFVQINEHVLLFPSIILTALVYFLDWHNNYILLVNPTLAVINFLLLYNLARATLKKHTAPLETRLFGLFIAVLLSSFTQYEIWSQGISTSIYLMANSAFLAAVYVLSRWPRSRKTISIAAFFCFISTFSAGYGLISWLAVFPLVGITHTHKRLRFAWHNAIAWAILFASTMFIYSAFDTGPSWLPSVWFSLHNPLKLLLFILAFTGTPLFPLQHLLNSLLGLILILTSFSLILHHFLKKKTLTTILPWACILLFSYSTTAAIAIGRISSVVNRATHSRYIPISSLSLISIIILFSLFIYEQKQKRLKHLLSILFVSLIIAQIGFGLDSLFYWQGRGAMLKQGKACIESYTISPDYCLIKLGNSAINGKKVKSLAPALERLGAFNQLVIPDNVNYITTPQTAMGLMEIKCLDQRCYNKEQITKREAKNILTKGWAQLDNCRPAEHVVSSLKKLFLPIVAVWATTWRLGP